MNKADMIEQIAQAAEVSKSAAERAVDALVAP
jgi:nucleoid DNA-binding protein